MSGLLNRVFSASSSSRPKYQSEAQPRSLDVPPPLPPASTWARHRGPDHRRTVSFDAISADSSKDDPRAELLVLRKENRRFKRKIEHLAHRKDVFHNLLEKSGIEIPDVPETPSPQSDEDDELAVTGPVKRLDTATSRTKSPDPIPYWINPSSPQSKLLQVLIAILLGRARTLVCVLPSDHTKIESLATEAQANAFHPSLNKDRALIAHCHFYLGLAKFRQGSYPEAAEYLDDARAAVVGGYLKGELVDEWVERCRDAMGETQSPIRNDTDVPSERTSQTPKEKGKAPLHEWTPPTANTAAVPLPAIVAPTRHHSSAALSETTIHPPSPTPPTPFRPSYLHSYANPSYRSRSPSPRPLPTDFPVLELINSHGNSSTTIRPTSPNAFSSGGGFSSPPSSMEGTPEMAQGAFGPFVPTHRRGRSGGGGSDGGISSRLAFWENQRGGSESDNSSVGGSDRQQRSASPEEAGQQQYQLPSVPEDEESADDDDNSEDEQRRQFLDHHDTSSSASSSNNNNNNYNQESPAAAAPNHDEVLADYFTSRRPHPHRSDSASFRSSASFSLSGAARRRRTTDESPIAGQGEVLANFWSSRANSIRSEHAAPPSPPASSSPSSRIHQPSSSSRTGSMKRSEVVSDLEHPPRAASTGGSVPVGTLPGVGAMRRSSRAHSLINQASRTGSLHSVPESEEAEEADASASARRPVGEMIARKWKSERERIHSPRVSRRESAAGSRVPSMAGSRRGSGSGSGTGSEKTGVDDGSIGGDAGGSGSKKKKRRRRRERKASRAAAAGRS